MMRGFLAPLALAPSLAAGHGAMMMPPSWFQENGAPCTSPTPHTDWSNGQMWYTNWTHIDDKGHGGDGQPTIAELSPLRTWGDKSWSEPVARNPWRAPGTSPLGSPCGVEGGNKNGCVHADGTKAPGCAVGGNPNGLDAVDVFAKKGFKNVFTTEWKVGSVVEAAWIMWSNHGGGYSYRLCPASSDLTEDCFQAGHLDFVGDTHTIQWGTNRSSRITIPAMYTTEGTYPEGAQWARLPIPACAGYSGGWRCANGCSSGCPPGYRPPYKCTDCETYPIDGHAARMGTQFPPPAPGLWGWGNDEDGHYFPFFIVDKLQIPKNLPAGEYILSFRWDCEQTPQVWSQCASIRLVDDDTTPLSTSSHC